MRRAFVLLCLFLSGPAAAQDYTQEEARLLTLCRDQRNADACVDLRNSRMERLRRGDEINIDVEQALRDECNADVPGACYRLDFLLRRMADSNDTETTPDASPEPPPIPVIDTEDTLTDPDTHEDEGWSWWRLLYVLLGLWVVRLFVRGYRRGMADLETLDSITPPIPLPDLRKGPRHSQGDLVLDGPDDHILTPWDRTFIHDWLDDQIEKARPLVTDQTFLDLCKDMAPSTDPDARHKIAAGDYLQRLDEPLAPDHSWTDPRFRYFNLLRARRDFTGGAYNIGNELWHGGIVDDPRIIVQLFRLDADKDFNPAGVNLHAIMVSKRLDYGDDMIRPDEMEAYLRHLFRLGAPDGYYHITAQLLDFYSRFDLRPDEGYVAAGYRRIKTYAPEFTRDWRDFFDRNPDVWNLDDTSVDFEGLMRLQAQQSQGPIQ